MRPVSTATDMSSIFGFGTLQKRLPQELRLAGITDMVEANRFLKEVFLPQHNARFATPAEDRGTAFVSGAGGTTISSRSIGPPHAPATVRGARTPLVSVKRTY